MEGYLNSKVAKKLTNNKKGGILRGGGKGRGGQNIKILKRWTNGNWMTCHMTRWQCIPFRKAYSLQLETVDRCHSQPHFFSFKHTRALWAWGQSSEWPDPQSSDPVATALVSQLQPLFGVGLLSYEWSRRIYEPCRFPLAHVVTNCMTRVT